MRAAKKQRIRNQYSPLEKTMNRLLPTDKQAAVLGFIDSYHREHGTPPSVRQIGEQLGIKSLNGVACHLKALKQKRWLTASKNKRRALRVAKGVAVVGEVR